MNPADWIGRVGDSWAREWRRTDRSFAALDPRLLTAIDRVAPTSRPFRALDIGCGAGATSLALAAMRPAAEIVGVDLSAALVAVARDRAAGQGAAGCTFQTGDALDVAAAAGPFDLMVSRHGVMFFEHPVAAFARLADAAAPGAALVFSCFADLADNYWATETVSPGAATSGPPQPGPFAFADPARVADILARAGWDDAAPIRVPFAYVAGEGADPVADALAFFRRIGPAARALADAGADDRVRLERRIVEACERYRDGDRVAFPAAAWLWSARKGVPR